MKHAILKNKHLNLAGLMIASVFALAACGGGGGGGDHGGGGGGLATGTFTRTFNAAPLNFAQVFGNAAFGDMTFQSLHTPAEIGGSGRITKLMFANDLGTASATTCPNTTFRLGHSSLTDLTTTYAGNMNAGTPLVVLNDATVTIPAGAAGSWFEISLTTPFDYNGFDNLVVQMDRPTTCSALVSARARSGVVNRLAVSFAADATPGTPDNNTTTGALFGYTFWMQFVFGGGDNRIDFGGVTSNSFPFFNTGATAGRKTQHLYLASEINGSGPITGIAFQANAVTVAGTYTYTLRLGHSTLPALGATFADNYAGSPTTVANAVANFTIPAGIPAGERIWIPIPDAVFTYNGIDNLIVEVSVPTGSASNALRTLQPAPNRRVFNNTDAAATTGTVDDYGYHIALRFNGGPMEVITPTGIAGGVGDAMPFWAVNGKRQYLYHAAELGTKGTISKLACRAVLPGAAETNFNYTVILSHSTASTLGTTYATNLATPTTVFSGVLNIPAVLVGDWLEIPFSTPFGYNGKDNLVVEVSGTGGTASGSACAMDLANAARYTGRRVFSGGSSDAAGTLQDNLIDMRFTLN